MDLPPTQAHARATQQPIYDMGALINAPSNPAVVMERAAHAAARLYTDAPGAGGGAQPRPLTQVGSSVVPSRPCM